MKARCISLCLRLGFVLTSLLLPALGRADDRVRTEAKINERPIILGIDTGAPELLIFAHAATQRGLKVTMPPAGTVVEEGKVLMGATDPLKLELFGQVLPNVQIHVVEVPAAIAHSDDIEGVVGWGTIRNNVSILTGGRHLTITMVPAPPSDLTDWISTRERVDWQTLYVELSTGTAGQPPAGFGIDTGSSHGIALAPAEWARWRAAHSRSPVTFEASYMPGAGLVVSEEAWADAFDLGGIMFREVPIRCMNGAETATNPPGTIATLGLFGLRRLDAVLDGKSHAMYFKPHAALDLGYQHNRLGAVFTPINLEADPLLAHVAAGTPAAKADVRDGDMLLKIDDLDVTPWRTQPGILPLQRFFVQPAGTKLRLTLRRGDQVIVAHVTLKDVLGSKK